LDSRLQNEIHTDITKAIANAVANASGMIAAAPPHSAPRSGAILIVWPRIFVWESFCIVACRLSDAYETLISSTNTSLRWGLYPRLWCVSKLAHHEPDGLSAPS
jgi:hypothetical protein